MSCVRSRTGFSASRTKSSGGSSSRGDLVAQSDWRRLESVDIIQTARDISQANTGSAPSEPHTENGP